jgi:hypothetical protein
MKSVTSLAKCKAQKLTTECISSEEKYKTKLSDDTKTGMAQFNVLSLII